MSLRRSARLLGVHRTTVARKLKFLASQSRLEHQRILTTYVQKHCLFRAVQFDELETFEHTKCKPVSVPLMVHPKDRLILGLSACSMPAKGPLARMARRKYGTRADHRGSTLRELFLKLQPFLAGDSQLQMTSDSNPHYPRIVQECFPQASHTKVISRRGCVVGQGELKKTLFDPIFALNHSCAMLRANIARLIRKTWNTTKRIEALSDHLAIYMVEHNRHILRQKRLQRA